MNGDSIVGDEIVNFPVPKRFLPVVVRALADAMEKGSTLLPPASPEPSASTAGETNKGWTKDDVVKLNMLLQNATVRKLLEMTTAAPQQWVGFKDLMDAAKRSYGEARGDLAGFTQLIKRNFDRELWPIEAEWSDEQGQVHYRASRDVASWWKAA